MHLLLMMQYMKVVVIFLKWRNLINSKFSKYYVNISLVIMEKKQ